MAAKETKTITPRKPAATVAKAEKKEPAKTTKAAPAKAAPKATAKPAAKPVEKSAKADGKDGNKKIYHVSKRDKDGREWKVFIQGSDKVIKLFKTQLEALDYAKTIAKNDGNATVMLHGLDGKIRKA